MMHVLIGEQLKRNTSVKCELTRVSSLQEALNQLAQRSFDVILLDLTLPDAQGLQTVDQMVAATPELPIGNSNWDRRRADLERSLKTGCPGLRLQEPA